MKRQFDTSYNSYVPKHHSSYFIKICRSVTTEIWSIESKYHCCHCHFCSLSSLVIVFHLCMPLYLRIWNCTHLSWVRLIQLWVYVYAYFTRLRYRIHQVFQNESPVDDNLLSRHFDIMPVRVYFTGVYIDHRMLGLFNFSAISIMRKIVCPTWKSRSEII